jgi:hypothetical protein
MQIIRTMSFYKKRAAQQIIVHEWPSSAFFEVVVPVESVYNQSCFAGPGHRVNSSVMWNMSDKQKQQ